MTFAHTTLKHLGRTALAICAVIILPHAAEAACSTPAGQEGDLRYDTTTKNFYFCNGTAWSFFSGLAPADYQVPTDIKYTNILNNGDFYSQVPAAVNGFDAINQWAQANGCSGYNVCTPSDIERWMSAGNEIPPVVASTDSSAWLMSDGMAQDSHVYIHTNCQRNTNPDTKWDAWSTSSASYSGMMLTVYDSVPPTSQLVQSRVACNTSMRVACCKY